MSSNTPVLLANNTILPIVKSSVTSQPSIPTFNTGRPILNKLIILKNPNLKSNHQQSVNQLYCSQPQLNLVIQKVTVTSSVIFEVYLLFFNRKIYFMESFTATETYEWFVVFILVSDFVLFVSRMPAMGVIMQSSIS